MDHTVDNGTVLLGITAGLWIIQKFLYLSDVLVISDFASIATILSGTCASTYWVYSLYKKIKNDRIPKEDN
jgi:hypothetical protein